MCCRVTRVLYADVVGVVARSVRMPFVLCVDAARRERGELGEEEDRANLCATREGDTDVCPLAVVGVVPVAAASVL